MLNRFNPLYVLTFLQKKAILDNKLTHNASKDSLADATLKVYKCMASSDTIEQIESTHRLLENYFKLYDLSLCAKNYMMSIFAGRLKDIAEQKEESTEMKHANILMISGHRDITQEEFDEHYVPLLNKAMDDKSSFVVGDCECVDIMAQEYLFSKGEVNVHVFHMFTAPRFAVERYKHLGGFQSDVDRDFAMTLFSDEDLCWIREGKERSGTAQNVQRRILKGEGVHSIQEIMSLEASMFL